MGQRLTITYPITSKEIVALIRTEKDGRIRQRLMAMKLIAQGHSILRPPSNWIYPNAPFVNGCIALMNKGHPVCGIHSGPVNELLMFITPYVVENSTQIREGGSIPVAEEGFKTLEQSRKIIEDKMMGLGIGFDAEQEVDAP